MKLPSSKYAAFVEHPRYGKGPRFTGLDVVADSPDGSIYCHWHSPPGVRIPNTGVVAGVTGQGKATLHVTHYFDVKRICRKCGGQFLFFAEEQKHWYEALLFPLEADCLDCSPCRKDEHRVSFSNRPDDTFITLVAKDVKAIRAKERLFQKGLDEPRGTEVSGGDHPSNSRRALG